MTNVIVKINKRLVPVLAEATTAGKLIDLKDILELFAFDNICKLAINVDSTCLRDDGAVGVNFMCAFETAASIISQRFQSVTVHKFADEIMRNKNDQGRSSDKKEDLLSRFISNEINSMEIN